MEFWLTAHVCFCAGVLGAESAWTSVTSRLYSCDPIPVYKAEARKIEVEAYAYLFLSVCMQVGYRRSTLSESIAQRWAVEHDADVLCANALEYALMQGMTAHGSQVY